VVFWQYFATRPDAQHFLLAQRSYELKNIHLFFGSLFTVHAQSRL